MEKKTENAGMKSWLFTGAFCMISVLGILGFCIFIDNIFERMGVGELAAETLAHLLSSVVILVIYRKVYGLQEFGLGSANFFRGLWTGGFMFFLTILNSLVVVMENWEYPVAVPKVGNIVLVVLGEAFVGIFEEFLFRGLLLHILLVKFKKNGFAGTMAAVLISSLVFGLSHFLNLQDQPVNSTISQVLMTTLCGTYWAVLYLRTNNIWVSVLYHALINLAASLTVLFFEVPDVPITDISAGDVLSTFLANLVILAVSLFLARKLREGEDSENAGIKERIL